MFWDTKDNSNLIAFKGQGSCITIMKIVILEVLKMENLREMGHCIRQNKIRHTLDYGKMECFSIKRYEKEMLKNYL